MFLLLNFLKCILFTGLHCREVKFVRKNLNFAYPGFIKIGTRNTVSRSTEDLFKRRWFLNIF